MHSLRLISDASYRGNNTLPDYAPPFKTYQVTTEFSTILTNANFTITFATHAATDPKNKTEAQTQSQEALTAAISTIDAEIDRSSSQGPSVAVPLERQITVRQSANSKSAGIFEASIEYLYDAGGKGCNSDLALTAIRYFGALLVKSTIRTEVSNFQFYATNSDATCAFSSKVVQISALGKPNT